MGPLQPNWQPKPLFGQAQSPTGMPPMPQMPQKPSGGIGGFARSVVKGAVDPFAYLANAAIVDPTKQLVAQATGNDQAYKNARQQSNKNLGMKNEGDIGGGLKKWAGNTAQVGLTAFAPGASSVKGAAALGAANSGAYSLANGGDLVDVLTNAALGAGTGGALKGGGAVTSKVTSKLGKGLDKQATKYATKQFGLTDSFIAKFNKKFGEDAGKVINKYNFSSVDDIQNQIGKQSKVFDKLVQNTGNIKKDVVQKRLDAIGQDLLQSGPSQQKGVGEKLLNETKQLLQDYDDEIPATVLNKIKGDYDKLVNYTMQQADPQTYGVNKRVADALRNTLQEASGSKQLKQTGLEISKLMNLADEVEKRAPAVASRAASPLGFRNLIGAAAGSGAAGPVGAFAGMGLSAAVNSPTGRKALAKGTQKAASGLMKDGGPGLGGFLAGRAVPGIVDSMFTEPTANAQSLEDAMLQSQSMPNQSQINPMTTTAASMSTNANTSNPFLQGNSNPMMDESYQNPQQMSSPYGRDSLLADIQRDPQNADKYLAYFQQLDEIYNPMSMTNLKAQEQMMKLQGGGEAPYSRPTASQYSQGIAGLQSVDKIEQLFNENPSLANKNATPGQRLPGVGGLVSRVAGTSTYRGAANNVLNSIARINTGANMPESERVFYEQTYLPQPGDDQSTVQYKLSNLRQFFQPIVSYSGSGGGLENALLQAQGAY